MGGTDAPLGNLTGPDLVAGIELAEIREGGMLLGHAHGEAVLLVRPAGGDRVFAIGPTCTHYSGPLAEGLCVGNEVRCPWHHARFDVTTGEAIAAPALDPVPCWNVERSGARVVVTGRKPRAAAPATVSRPPGSIVIVGAGAAGNAAAEMLRREGYSGPVTMICADAELPVDRPNLSKDFLAGTAPEAWVFLRGDEFYAAHGIELIRGKTVTAVDVAARRVRLSDGSEHGYGALLLATGADPVKLPFSGSAAGRVLYLRSLADSRALIAAATRAGASSAVVVGASFIGLEVAASLRTRGLEVHVVAPDARPLERVLGPQLGDFVRLLHEEHGVRFHLGHTLHGVEPRSVTLDDGGQLPADLVIAGVGVRPSVALAEQAGLRIDRGVVVNEQLETSAPGVYAAGDIARWVEPRSGASVRIEHWVVAETQGQTAARNMLGRNESYRAVPFFWSQHYDVAIAYVGHAESWDAVEVAGSIDAKSCLVAYRSAGKILAVATIGKDRESLEAERLLERDDQAGLRALIA